MTTDFEIVEKESVHSLNFPSTDVLQDDDDAISQRTSDLERALSLGNLEHSKMRIFFEDDQSKKVVETTIWGVTDKRVILKQGVVIPINRIYRIS
jgi:hypothetical protein